MQQPAFLQKPLEEMSPEEWESLCDGCALCCQHSEEDEESGELWLSNVACKQLCLQSHTCKDYANRQAIVPECIKATPQNLHTLTFLPPTCGYKLAAAGQALPRWHHLICGDREEVHRRGISMKGLLVSEED